jgi:homoserine O-succinyltransferase
MAVHVETRPGSRGGGGAASPADLVIGLVNNMPDAALESTEAQFIALLSAAASGGRALRLRLTSLPQVPRGADAQAHIDSQYWPLHELLDSKPDALIVTGTEPRSAVLSDEPYWQPLTEVIDYAATRTISSVYSCLAAHAVALYLDGIPRERLATKRFGVFDERIETRHPLTDGLRASVRAPHSRWNDLPAHRLMDAGYTILTRSAEVGVGAFCKQSSSLSLLFQGHPEYHDGTLLKEYRRDVGRYVSGERADYPAPPLGYFGPEVRQLLTDYERACVSAGQPNTLAAPVPAFPFRALAAALNNDWADDATQIYRNWLNYIAAQKGAAQTGALHALP